MGDYVTTSIPCDKSLIFSRIFSKTKWKEEMTGLGFTALFIGVDLERFDKSGSVSDGTAGVGSNVPAYLALGLATEETDNPLAKYPEGFPERALFFDCLKPWTWVNKRRHDIRIKDSSIELNISEYYRKVKGETLLANPADVMRLVKERPNAATKKYTDQKHITYAITYSDEDPERILLFIYGQNLSVLVQLWGEGRLWQFVSTRS